MKHLKLTLWSLVAGVTISAFATVPYVGRSGQDTTKLPAAKVCAGGLHGVQMPVKEREASLGIPVARLVDKSRKKLLYQASGNHNVEFWGSLVYYTEINPGERPRDLGLSKYTTDGDYESILPGFAANGSGVFLDGKFNYVYKFIKDLGENGKIDLVYQYEVDLETLTVTGPIEVGHEMIATDVTYDPVTGKIYGCFYSEDLTKFQFGTVDYTSHTRSTLADLDMAYNALAADDDGTLYGVDMNGDFCEVNKTNGAKRVIGPTGYKPSYVTSGAIDYRTGDFYWTVAPADGSGFLCVIDKTTGKATKVMDFLYDEEITALYIPIPEAEDKAPGALSDVSLSFPMGSMSGTATFTMPTTLFDGTEVSGACSYTISSGEDILATGSSSYGNKVTADITLRQSGKQQVCLYANNSEGRGPITRVDIFGGKDSPAVPTGITAEYTSGRFSISWDKVEDSLEGGYIDPGDVKYTVKGYPWGNLIAKSTSATSCQYDYTLGSEFGVYWFTVEAEYDGKKSGVGESNKIAYGSYSTPADIRFDENAMAGWNICDMNGDGISWISVGEELGCPTNPLLNMDDWAISPKIRLAAGETYKISIDMRSNREGFPEDLEVCVGSESNPDFMDDVVIGVTRVTSTSPATFSGYFSPDKDGDYYIGLHGVSIAFTDCLLVSGIHVSAPVNGNVPASPTRFYGVRARDGEQEQARLTFRAPSKSLNGKDLTSLTSIRIIRNGAGQISEITNPVPGKDYEYLDNVDEKGTYTYTLIPVNSYGEGEEISTIAYVLSDLPEQPEFATAVETGDSGFIKLEWGAIKNDLSGFPLDADEFTYTIAAVSGADMDPVAQGLKDTRYEYQAVEEGKQEFRQFAIFGVNSTGQGTEKLIRNLAYGKPYTAPWRESLPQRMNQSILSSAKVEADGEWLALDDDNFQDVTAVDGDMGFLCMTGSSSGASAMLQFGKINTAGLQAPVFSCFTYNFSLDGEGADVNTLDLEVFDGNEWTLAESWTVDEACGGKPGWNRIYASLDKWKGDIVQLRLTGRLNNISVILVDCLAVSDVLEKDVSVSDVKAPESVTCNQDFTVTATVANYGKTDLSDITVRLLCNGKEIERKEHIKLMSGIARNVSFRCMANAASDDELIYSVVADCEGDLNPEDNSASADVTEVNQSSLPAVRNIAESVDSDGKRTVIWDEPEYGGVTSGSRVIDNFETYESFSYENFGDWTLIDADDAETWSLAEISFPGINKGQHLSFFVMDASNQQLNNTFNAHSGNKYLSNLAAKEVASDDWLVSPELSGEAQNIRFYARSYNPAYKETFEFLVSYAGTDIEDFRLVERRDHISGEWTLYSYDIPEGSRYFAIRCISNDALMLHVDDVAFTPALRDGLSLTGYNVYVDGNLLTTLGSESRSYDTAGISDTSDIAVSAVYNAGESRASHIDRSGVASILDNCVLVRGLQGYIGIENAEYADIQVIAIDGTVLFSGEGTPAMKISAEHGVYVVRVNGVSFQVLVR